MKLARLLFFPLLALCHFLSGQDDQRNSIAFSVQVLELKQKSLAHEKEIESLLSQANPEPTNFVIPTSRSEVPSPESVVPVSPVPPAPYLPVPDYYETKGSDDIPLVQEKVSTTGPVAYPDDSIEKGEGLDLNNSDDATSKELIGDTKKEIIFERHDGYYFGPLLGFLIPNDGAVRDLGNNSKRHFESDAGYFVGIQFGKDFGTIRWEVEYSHQGFDGEGGGTDFQISAHDFMTRLVLEKEIGDLIDLRAGLGTGIGFISIENNQDFSGESFVYDFGIGASYRLRENMNLSLDYRYFLSAAEDQYDRLEGHIFTASANFDL